MRWQLPCRRAARLQFSDACPRLPSFPTRRSSDLAFDVVLSPGIPDKGKILNEISVFWFQHFADIDNHLIETDFDRLDRKSTRLNSSHITISYAVFCLKKKRSALHDTMQRASLLAA